MVTVGNKKTRVAIIGASGIGKHHARWWTLEGADVCAFAGTSAASLAAAEQGLNEQFAFQGRGYTDVEEMLEAERPDIVDVCSPPPLHFEHVETALRSGCHVLCEKPFVYDPEVPSAELMRQARSLFSLAEDKGLRLGICTQYAVAARFFQTIWNERRGNEPIVQYDGFLETPAKNRPPDAVRIWSDLAPHLLSVLLCLAPDGQLDEASLSKTFTGYRAEAQFRYLSSGTEIACRLCASNFTEGSAHQRIFTYNGYTFRVEGQADTNGVYCSRIETADGPFVRPDTMRVLIREFLSGHCVATPAQCLRNLELMLRVQDWNATG